MSVSLQGHDPQPELRRLGPSAEVVRGLLASDAVRQDATARTMAQIVTMKHGQIVKAEDRLSAQLDHLGKRLDALPRPELGSGLPPDQQNGAADGLAAIAKVRASIAEEMISVAAAGRAGIEKLQSEMADAWGQLLRRVPRP